MKKKKQSQLTTPPEPIEDDSKLTEEQKNNLLVDLFGTRQWQALKILIDNNINAANIILRSIDPFKEPTQTARQQGIIIGLYSLETYIYSQVEIRRQREKEANTGVSADDSLPSY